MTDTPDENLTDSGPHYTANMSDRDLLLTILDRLDTIDGQVSHIASEARPVLEQIMNSPLMRMLNPGGKNRG